MRQILASPQAAYLPFLFPLFLCLYLLALPFLLGRDWTWLLPLVLYGSLLAVESVRLMAGGNRPRVGVWLPLLFVVVHLGYGLGLLWGVVDRVLAGAGRIGGRRAGSAGPVRVRPLRWVFHAGRSEG